MHAGMSARNVHSRELITAVFIVWRFSPAAWCEHEAEEPPKGLQGWYEFPLDFRQLNSSAEGGKDGSVTAQTMHA